MSFETFLDDSAPLLRQQVQRVDALQVREDLEFDRGVRVKVDRVERRDTGQANTELWVELDREASGGFGALLGVADEMEAVYPQGVSLIVQYNAGGNGYFVLADHHVEDAARTWIQTIPQVFQQQSRLGAGDGFSRLYELRTPGIDDEGPVFQALLDPTIALAGAEYAVDIAQRRMRPDSMI